MGPDGGLEEYFLHGAGADGGEEAEHEEDAGQAVLLLAHQRAVGQRGLGLVQQGGRRLWDPRRVVGVLEGQYSPEILWLQLLNRTKFKQEG